MAPPQWGIPSGEIDKLGERLLQFFNRFRPLLQTKTRDTSDYGFCYMNGLLRMETKRNFAGIARATETSIQNLQHFISNSPWSPRPLIDAIQTELHAHPAFQQAMLVLDESAEQKSGEHSAGAGRQHNGRLGKVEMSQVGVFLSLVTPQVNLWIDGELFLPEHWFTPGAESRRKAAEIPEELTFQTKPQIGLKMIRYVQRQQIPFHAVLLDTLYGRNQELRTALDTSGIEYYADVPATTKVYSSPPGIHHPIGKRGKPSKHPEFKGMLQEVRQLRETLEKQWICIRPNERGYLCAWWSRSRVWVRYGDTIREEWLLIRHDESGKLTYVLSNASVSRSLEEMAWRKTHRYLIERSHQDAKSELGWDEFQARKYQAWTHHLALTILACWFIAQTRLDWNERFRQDPNLLKQYEAEVLPQLSVANVRTLLRAALPLPNLSPEQAAQLVKDHLVNRTRSRKSRLRREKRENGS